MSGSGCNPFAALKNMLTGILNVTGRLLAGIIGAVLILLGVILSLTIIGAIIGVPMVIIGVLLVIRCLF